VLAERIPREPKALDRVHAAPSSAACGSRQAGAATPWGVGDLREGPPGQGR